MEMRKADCMKAAVYYGKGDVRIEELPVPAVREDEVLVEVRACGVCGTDIHIFEGAKGAAECTPPTVLGHEFSGIVAAAGAGVHSVRVGDRVCIDPNDTCGECDFCRTGRAHFCTGMHGYGTTVNGGFAQFCAVRAKQAYRISGKLSFEEAAMTEPVSCCLHGIDLADIRPGSSVMVIGGGPIGLIILQLARLAGAAAIVLLEPVESKRRLAERMGATLTLNPLTDDIPQELARNGFSNIDTVIECAGLGATMRQAIDYAGRKATVVLFGLTDPDCEIPLKPFEVFQKELKITASYINPYTFDRALKILESGKIDVKSIIAQTVALTDMVPVFTDAGMRRNGKVVVCP